MRALIVACATALLFLVCFSPDSYSQCGVAPTTGTTTVNTASKILNSYYPGTGSPAAGANSLNVGTRDTRGATTALANGDMVVIIQMQGADINTANSDSYGDGVSGGAASGYLSTNLVAGTYEYNIVSAFNTGTGKVTFSNTLANSYFTRAYSAANSKQSYQVVLVPRYFNLTVNSTRSVTAPAWNGSSGGIIVLETANTLTLNGSIVADGLGFRGGGGKFLSGTTTGNTNGSGSITNTDYRWASPATTAANATGGAKGEGIAGTPMYTLANGATSSTTNSSEGYLGGSMGRGAPGNGGGGGTDGDPTANQYNPGGGGGSNGGAGGQGGSGWDGGSGNPATYPTGGYGGAVFSQGSLTRLIAGGGGGAGCSNNSAATTEYICSGGAGGGIILVRAKSFAGSGSLSADGANANNVSNPPIAITVTDAAGGGGAGGSIIILTNATGGTLTNTITASATGGTGGNMTNYFSHGPGGGGGGGRIISNFLPLASATATGGAHGLTRTGSTTGAIDNVYGSLSGSNGTMSTFLGIPSFANANNVASPCGELPITLESFSGVYRNGEVDLRWQTDAGVNFSHFIVEHSTDGASFTALAQVTALGQSGSVGVFSYVYTDASPAAGPNFYRLRMVDLDGQYRYSDIISIDGVIKGFTVSASPNPFRDHVTVNIESNSDESLSMLLINSEGKIISRKNVNINSGTSTYYFNDLQYLPAGIYFMSINRKNATNKMELVKQ
jgi:hypothetical protein